MRRRLTLPLLVLASSLSWESFGSMAFAAEPTTRSALQPPASPQPVDSAKSAESTSPVVEKEAAKPATKSTLKLDAEVTALLRRTALALENRAIEPSEEAGFRALITAGDLLREDKTLAPSERERLRALCRVRLAQAEEVLKRQTAKQDAAKQADGKRKIAARNAVLQRPATVAEPTNPNLAQQFPGGAAFGQPNAGANNAMDPTRASAEELMEIITTSIKPESWEENGGTGVIRYFQLGHALVIRATADTHGDLGAVIRQLRN